MSVQGLDTLALLWDRHGVAESTQRLSMRGKWMDNSCGLGRRRRDKDAVVGLSVPRMNNFSLGAERCPGEAKSGSW